MRGHPAELVDVLCVYKVGLNYSGMMVHLDRLLGEVDAVVDNKERVVGLEDFVVEGDAVEIVLEERLQHLVVLAECFLLLLDGQSVQLHLIVSFKEVVQVLELLILLRCQLLELVPHLLGDLALIYRRLVEW